MRRALGLLVAGLVAVAAGVGAQAAGLLRGAEQHSLAMRFDLRGAEPAAGVVVVGVDDRTFSDTGRQWPFPRSMHARVIDALDRAGARRIVYDVQFTEPTKPRQDRALYDAVARAGGVLLATTEFDSDGATNVLGGDDVLAGAGARAGAANLPESEGGQLERFPYAVGPLRSLSVLAAEDADGPAIGRSAFGDDGAWIDFRGGPGTIRTVSFSDVLAGTVPASVFRGRVVVVGATAPSLQDVHSTPTSSDPMAGPEILANAIWTALHGLPLRSAPPWTGVALIVLLGLAAPLLRLRLRVVRAVLGALLLGAVHLAVAQALFQGGTIVSVTAPLVALATGILTMLVASHLRESARRRRVTRVNAVLEEAVRERTRELEEAQLEILQRLARAAEWRDEDTGAHVARIGILTRALALALGLPEAEAEAYLHASTAHDIGKVAVPDRILLKPGPLDTAERVTMEAHAAIGASMLAGSRVELLQLAEVIARTHHERWDGGGYPAGLRGEEIPLAGRICAICDVFDALVSARPYKGPWSLESALAELRAQSGSHFDPALVDAFTGIAEAAYPQLYGGSVRPVLVGEQAEQHTVMPGAGAVVGQSADALAGETGGVEGAQTGGVGTEHLALETMHPAGEGVGGDRVQRAHAEALAAHPRVEHQRSHLADAAARILDHQARTAGEGAGKLDHEHLLGFVAEGGLEEPGGVEGDERRDGVRASEPDKRW